MKNLLALAQDESASEEEARTSALQAARLMKENDLQLIAGKDLREAEKVVREAERIVKANRGDHKKQLAIGAAIGFILAGGRL